MLLFHILEFAKKPQEIIKEAYDAIIKGGSLIVLGFNPQSLWGLSRLLRHRKTSIWSGSWISPNKLRHWLVNAGFQVGDYQTFYFRPPTKKTERMLFMEGIGQIFWPYCGASYMFVAHKTTEIVASIGPLKHVVNHPKIAAGLAKPTSRTATQ